LTLGIRNVQTLFKSGALTSLPSQPKKYRLDERIPNKVLNGKFHNTRPAGKPRRRWEDVVRRDTSQILGIRGWRRWAKDREKWRRLVREVRAQRRLQRRTWNYIS
jgi:hypothetical protein